MRTFHIGDLLPWDELGSGVKRQIMGYNDGLMMVKVAFEKDAIGAIHSHKHTQASFVSSGQFEVSVAGELQLLSAGDGFFADPNALHGVRCIEQGEIIDVFTPKRDDFLSAK